MSWWLLADRWFSCLLIQVGKHILQVLRVLDLGFSLLLREDAAARFHGRLDQVNRPSVRLEDWSVIFLSILCYRSSGLESGSSESNLTPSRLNLARARFIFAWFWMLRIKIRDLKRKLLGCGCSTEKGRGRVWVVSLVYMIFVSLANIDHIAPIIVAILWEDRHTFVSLRKVATEASSLRLTRVNAELFMARRRVIQLSQLTS